MSFSLKSWPKFAREQTSRIEQVFANFHQVNSAATQFLLGDILVIRTAQILEEALPEIFYRLTCNAPYVDGTMPTVTHRATGLTDAPYQMRTRNRGRNQLNYLRWLQGRDIRKNVEHMLDVNEHALNVVDRFSAQLNELRIVRNEAAHGTKSTKAQYRDVLRAYYGSARVIVPVEKFVISDKRTQPEPLIQYTTMVRTLVKEICKA